MDAPWTKGDRGLQGEDPESGPGAGNEAENYFGIICGREQIEEVQAGDLAFAALSDPNADANGVAAVWEAELQGAE